MVEKTESVAAPTEEKKNCAGCGKPMKKAKRYYRNGEYYCNKNCFKNKEEETQGKQKEPA